MGAATISKWSFAAVDAVAQSKNFHTLSAVSCSVQAVMTNRNEQHFAICSKQTEKLFSMIIIRAVE